MNDDYRVRETGTDEFGFTPSDNYDASEPKGPIGEAIDQVKDVVRDLRLLIEAEKAYLTQRIAYTRAQLVKLLLFGALAATFAVFMLFALIIGVLLILTELLGPLLATIITVGALLIITALLGLACRNTVQRLKLK